MTKRLSHPEVNAEVIARPILIPAHGRGVLRPFRKGEIANPTGASGLYRKAQRICREATPDASRKMVQLLHCGDPRVELMAAIAIWERGFGKPREYKDEAKAPQLDFSSLDAEELATFRRLLRKAADTEAVTAVGEG